ncbi:hypothetical protein CAEBREN_12393 [Caenorhabditis brenneri]|uniref:Uncharacterized protein n=1 Tax=Caenorhabditis brenneri TaxID=135651 RepID=G0P661_CAEBE|nr:hypothetical protein CAEBREN_12393 [Caenorhabditis brenneri]
MITYRITAYFTDVGFYSTIFTNSFLIYLTVFHIKKVTGTYKKMVLAFATLGFLFSLAEHIARPFAHNYNEMVLWFSVNDWVHSNKLLQFGILFWITLYYSVVAFVGILFVYRYFCLFDTKMAERFDGFGGSLVWMGYPFLPGGLFCVFFYLFCQADEYSDERMRQDFYENYSLNVTEVARFVMIPYSFDGSIRWKDLCSLLIACSLISSHYLIIFYCGIKMHRNMSKELEKFSVNHGNLQKQFFRALVIQSLGPTVFLIIPAAPLVLTPFVYHIANQTINIQTGWLYTFVGIFPPFDSIAFMLIVAEYKIVIRKRLLWFLGNNSQVSTTSVSSEIATKRVNPESLTTSCQMDSSPASFSTPGPSSHPAPANRTRKSLVESKQGSLANNSDVQPNKGVFPLEEKLAMQEKINQQEKEIEKLNAVNLEEENTWERISWLEGEIEKLTEESRTKSNTIEWLDSKKEELSRENRRLTVKLDKANAKNKKLEAKQLQHEKELKGSLVKEMTIAMLDRNLLPNGRLPGRSDPQSAQLSRSPDHNQGSRSTSPDHFEQEVAGVPEVSEHPSTSDSQRKEDSFDATGSLKTESKMEKKKQKTFRVRLLSDDGYVAFEQKESGTPKVFKYPSTFVPRDSAGNAPGSSETGSKIRQKMQKASRRRLLSDESEIPEVSKYPSTSGPRKRKVSASIDEPSRADPKAEKLNRKKKRVAYQHLIVSDSDESPEEDEFVPVVPKGLRLCKPKAEDDKKTKKEKVKKEAKLKSEEKENQEPKKEVKMESPPPASLQLGSDSSVIDLTTESEIKEQKQAFRLLQQLKTDTTDGRINLNRGKRTRARVNYTED